MTSATNCPRLARRHPGGMPRGGALAITIEKLVEDAAKESRTPTTPRMAPEALTAGARARPGKARCGIGRGHLNCGPWPQSITAGANLRWASTTQSQAKQRKNQPSSACHRLHMSRPNGSQRAPVRKTPMRHYNRLYMCERVCVRPTICRNNCESKKLCRQHNLRSPRFRILRRSRNRRTWLRAATLLLMLSCCCCCWGVRRNGHHTHTPAPTLTPKCKGRGAAGRVYECDCWPCTCHGCMRFWGTIRTPSESW